MDSLKLAARQLNDAILEDAMRDSAINKGKLIDALRRIYEEKKSEINVKKRKDNDSYRCYFDSAEEGYDKGYLAAIVDISRCIEVEE